MGKKPRQFKAYVQEADHKSKSERTQYEVGVSHYPHNHKIFLPPLTKRELRALVKTIINFVTDGGSIDS